MKNTLFAIGGAVVTVLLWLVWQRYGKKMQEPAANCDNYLIVLKRSEIGTIEFSTIPTQLLGTGVKKVEIGEGSIGVEASGAIVAIFEKIATARKWKYTKTHKC